MKILLPLFGLLFTSAVSADQANFFQIQKVKKNDTLNIRSQATYKSAKVGIIPFNAKCVKNNGCGKDIHLEAMMNMDEMEIKAFLAQAQPGWCYIEYEGSVGWVNQHYLSTSTSVCK